MNRNKVEGLTRPDFKIYCKAVVIKTVLCHQKDQYIDEWKGIGSPEREPKYRHERFKGAKAFNTESIVLSTSGSREIKHLYVKQTWVHASYHIKTISNSNTPMRVNFTICNLCLNCLFKKGINPHTP